MPSGPIRYTSIHSTSNIFKNTFHAAIKVVQIQGYSIPIAIIIGLQCFLTQLTDTIDNSL